MLDPRRRGRLTSSEIWKIMTKAKGPGLSAKCKTYIKEINADRMFPLPDGSDAGRFGLWGTLMEVWCAESNYWGLDHNTATTFHDKLPWCGTADFLDEETVYDQKSPWTATGAYDLWNCHSMEDLKLTKPEYFWQLVSNSLLYEKKRIGLISYIIGEEDFTKMFEWLMSGQAPEDQLELSRLHFVADWSHDKLPILATTTTHQIIGPVLSEWQDELLEKIRLVSEELEG